jgi:hypothetical protein
VRKTAQRKLKQAFREGAGRQPAQMTIVEVKDDVTAYVPSEWRQLKATYKRSRLKTNALR